MAADRIMTQEEKELLLQDLCGRLAYDVKVDFDDWPYYINGINPSCQHIGYISLLIQDEKRQSCAKHVQIEDIKPYLRQTSSMTDTEKESYDALYVYVDECLQKGWKIAFSMATDWLNKHHFDYRGLIEKGLALEAPEGIYETNGDEA